MSHLCYNCNKVCKYSELSYECMCIHTDDTVAKFRGVCLDCAQFRKTIKTEPGHILKRIHHYSKECHLFWKDLEDKYPNFSWTKTDDGKISVSCIDLPEGCKNGKEMIEKYGYNDFFMLYYVTQKRRTGIVEPPNLNCTCC